MSLLAKVFVVIALVWLALLPPLFTNGACSAHFERESSRLESDRKAIESSAKAGAYWRERSVPHAVLDVDQCRRAKPRSLARCGSGPLVIARVPVNDPICRVYRDDEVRVLLQYDELDRLSRLQLDMNPYRSLPIPLTDVVIHWAR